MAKKNKAPALNTGTPYVYGGPQAVESYRPLTPAEVVDNSHVAIIQTSALNSVTHMAMDSAATIAMHRLRLIAEYPCLEAELNALSFNHVQGLLQIQRNLTESMYREQS